MEEQKALQEKMLKFQEMQMLLSQIGWIKHNHAMRAELEISDDQIANLEKVGGEYQKAMQEVQLVNRDRTEQIQQLVADGKHQEAQQLAIEFQTEMYKLAEPSMKSVESTLLPHQLHRIKQIGLQQRAKASNKFGDEFGVALALRKQIGLTDEEFKKLEDVIADSRKEFYEKVKQLKEEANEKIMAAIPKAKQEKLKEILGEDYNREEAQRASMQKMREKAQEQMKVQREKAMKAARERVKQAKSADEPN
jgi:hypothetical protein